LSSRAHLASIKWRSRAKP